MERHFNHLTFTDRLRIEEGQRHGLKAKDIATELGIHISTVYRELKRGSYAHKTSYVIGYRKRYKFDTRYSPDIAEEKYRRNLQAKGSPLKIDKDYHLADYIEHRIVDDGLTPLAVIGEIKKKNLYFDTSICFRTLYSYIDKGIFLRLGLKHLVFKGKQKKSKRKLFISRPPRGSSIEKRPAFINNRSEFGHWEMDCVCGPTKNTFLVLTERLTRKEIIFGMQRQCASDVVECLNFLEKKYGNKMFCKIFKRIKKNLKTRTFFIK